MSDARNDWRKALALSPECIEIARFGEDLDKSERAHLESCVRCQAELALYRELEREESSPEEERAAQWIAGELERRFRHSGNVVPFRPKRFHALAAAAALLILIGAGTWIRMREPSIDSPIGAPVYRSARLDVITPTGDLAHAPNELRWTTVLGASRYRVQLLEVDATLLWSGDTTETHVALPPSVIAHFAPGKTLLWEVRAFRGNEMLASSETQTVRVRAP